MLHVMMARWYSLRIHAGKALQDGQNWTEFTAVSLKLSRVTHVVHLAPSCGGTDRRPGGLSRGSLSHVTTATDGERCTPNSMHRLQ